MAQKVKRLFEQFHPQHYIIDLTPDAKKMIFSGTVIISGHKVGRPSKRLTLHQSGLSITNVHVLKHDKSGDREVNVTRTNPHNRFDELRLHSNDLLYPGAYTIRLSFKGRITRPMNGLYPCDFTYKGKKQKLLATQFESHHAREVFPCIDEPEAKATFDLSLTLPTTDVVVANTPILEQVKAGRFTTTTFETTPKMSTYLLAFVSGNMKYLSATTKHGIEVRTYATPNNVKHLDFALDVGVKCLDFFNDYFGIEYPLKKCDFIALSDFASGAMENWGCITFREQALLVDKDNTSLSTKEHVALVIAHELAHQWFGNLVTMRWWTDLWLNEGFASWVEYMAVDHLFPDWHLWTQFIVDEQYPALRLDALEHTHPVEVPVHHPDEIRTIFDTISYGKGASVLHMLHTYLGARDFKAGLQYYLKKHAYGNTDTLDLWAALEEVSHKPVKEFMHAWTSQSGYPLLHATVEDDKVTVTQEPFLLNRSSKKTTSRTWPISLHSENSKLPALLDTPHGSWPIAGRDELKLNRNQSGFYRTVYNATHREHLGLLVERGHFGPLDRLGLLSDSFEAAKAGYSDATEALQLLKHYHNEENSAVWDIIAGNLASIRAVMNDDIIREGIKPYTRKLVAKELARLGWREKKSDSHFDRLLRPTILAMASVSDEPEVVAKCLQLFTDEKRRAKIHPDLRGLIYTTAARRGDNKTFDTLLAMHNTTDSSEERVTLTAALTSFEQPELVRKSLACITSDDVRLQDVTYWLAYSFANRHAKVLTWEWVIKNWQWLSDNLGHDLGFYHLPIYVARAFSDEQFLKSFKTFFNGVSGPAFKRPINQGIEIIQCQSAWRKRDLKLLQNYFK